MPKLQTAAICRITVGDKQIKNDISSLQLEQHLDDHHILRVRVRQLGIATSKSGFDDPSSYTALLGEPISVTIEPQGGIVDSSRQMEFIGVVTEVSLDNSIDGLNTILLTAHSPTVAADGARHRAFYQEQTAGDIIESVIREYSVTAGNIESTSGSFAFSVQYDETDYEYIMRLASGSGKFAYYDGKEFILAAASGGDNEALNWRESLGAFAMGLGTVAEKFTSQAFDYSKKEVYDGKTEGALRTSLSDLAKVSFGASETMYPKASFLSANKSGSQASLDQTIDTARERAVGRMVVCKGESIVPAVAVGHCVEIKGMDKLNGVFWVKEVTHLFDEAGKYSNAFTCTPLDAAFPAPRPSHSPFTDLQSALVVDTDDPDSLGRVKICFHWKLKDSAEAGPEKWVRMATPHAGKNKGWFCLPEVDDEVLVGFAHGDADQPMILGSLYNGKDVPPIDHPAGWSAADNDLKLFRTKSGNEIYFHDGSGSETICIVQKDGENSLLLTLDGP
ncbi:MAG: type VI secretion system Vgr family protein, partial [candidate division Zixibacteria bacterium]|nr:type VI secretion system Vgr family protein [candidate division Zixibacteria bacterium]